MIVNVYFERESINSAGSNFPTSNYGADYFTINVGGKSMTGISALRTYLDHVNPNNPQPANSLMTNEIYTYTLSDAQGLPTGMTSFSFSGINAPADAGDEVVVTVEVYGNVSAATYQNTTANSVNTRNGEFLHAGDNGTSNTTTLTDVPNTPMTQPGRTASDFWYIATGITSKEESLAFSGTNWVTNISSFTLSNPAGTTFPSSFTGVPVNETDGLSMLTAYSTGNSTPPTATLTKSNSDLINNMRITFLPLAPFAKPSISGTVYLDTDGPTNINGTGTDGGGLYVNVLDNNNYVVATTAVGNDGKFTIPSGIVIEGSNYTLQLTKNAGTVGNLAPATALNSNWSTVGENRSGTGNDGSPDGLLTIPISYSNISGTTFGILQTFVTPITLESFNAIRSGSNALLNWSTLSETNNKGFEIQRSTDGRNFDDVNFVASTAVNGTSSSRLAYSYSDPAQGNGTYYYRLKQIDFDSKESLSYVKSVVFDGIKTSVNMAPNPVINSFKLSNAKVGSAYRIVNMSGQQMASATVTSSDMTINISNMVAGMYILQVQDASGNTIALKFIKK